METLILADLKQNSSSAIPWVLTVVSFAHAHVYWLHPRDSIPGSPALRIFSGVKGHISTQEESLGMRLAVAQELSMGAREVQE